MGNCVISIHVTGGHHNGLEDDIDQMAARFVDELAKNHNVTAAYLATGAAQDLRFGDRKPLRAETQG
jgi:hypothetical protein